MNEVVKTDRFGISRHQIPDDAEIVAESGRAILVRRPLPKKHWWSRQRYRTECSCPYACLAAMEPCEFASKCSVCGSPSCTRKGDYEAHGAVGLGG